MKGLLSIMKSLKLLLVAPFAIGALSALTSCGNARFIPGSPDTDKIDVTLDTKGVTITMWSGFGSDMSKCLEDRLEEFTAKTGIIVKHESKSGYPNLLKAINLASTSGSFPNIANGYPDHFASYVKSNILLRLDGLLENDAKRGEVQGAYTQNGKRFGADGIKLMDYEDFYDDYVVENETLEFKEDGSGYILGVPFNKSTEEMVYNADLFDWAAKQDAWKDKIFVPKTWAEVKSVGLAVKELVGPLFKTAEADGKILADNGNVYSTTAEVEAANAKIVMNMTNVLATDFRPFTYDAGANLFITLVRQYGGQYTEVDKTKTGRGYAVFDSDETRAALTMLKDLFDTGIAAIPSFYNELYCSNAFKAYKSVMNVGSTAGLANITSNAIKTKIAPIPYKDADHKYVISQGTSLGLFNKGTDKQKLAAWKLMVYLSQQDNGQFAADTGYYPTCDYSYNSDGYQEYLDSTVKSDTDKLRLASAEVNNNEYVENHWNKFVDPGFRGSADIREQVELIPGYLMTNTYDVQGTIDAIYRTISDYIKD